MKELTFKNERLNLTIVLRVNEDNEVISSFITFNEPMDLSTIFPSRGILLGMRRRPGVPEPPRPLGHKFPSDQEMPNWLAKDLKRRKDGRI